MNFLTYFRGFSYAMIGVAMLALVLAGGLDYGLALAFLAVMIVSWKLEGSRWQLPERYGLTIVILSIPLFYLVAVATRSFSRRRNGCVRFLRES